MDLRLAERAHTAAGLPAAWTPADAVRYALAVLAGDPDPAAASATGRTAAPTHGSLVRARVDARLVERARAAARLPAAWPTAWVIRYAVAVMAGEPDPARTAATPPGFPPGVRRRPDTDREAQARRYYRASLATGSPIARGALARRYAIAEWKARQIVADCKAERQAAA